ncbi:DUF3131 domain-containing protein [Beggiatoa leptomitoformis]|uniref:DUF3131 domain-containing protein n=1 Tax=Beggiatoa leptomitoformis TaxID=288004 RepID=A0A2N9YJU7_9GAMM|nr:DUF3131 domain-containing protein [Beggiatoa leptomitoformis]ALG67471.1 DUF3131 domain-containing protein [Beggiatoa leptomitoformis]AUI70696.2 DUF3131 domain-containing protein [Beggiatoa leptomitoformis]
MKRVFLFLSCFCLLNSCGVLVRSLHRGAENLSTSPIFYQGRHGDLTEEEQQWAKIAWLYFENNYNPATGMVNTKDGYPSASLWDIADTIAATLAAKELKLINDYVFDQRISTLLNFLNRLDLAFGKLPNKLYHASQGNMTNYANEPDNIGWSAVDIGRLLIWLHILKTRLPQYSEYVDKAVLRWHFCEIVDDCGNISGAYKDEQQAAKLYDDTRIGYTEYAQTGYQIWGFETYKTQVPYAVKNILGIDIIYDSRDPRRVGNYSPVVSMPYLLHGLELNWDKTDDTQSTPTYYTDSFMADSARNIYAVQAERYAKDKIFTARTDHAIGFAPYFVQDSIFAGGFAWNTLDTEGNYLPHLALVSTRATFGLWALWKTPYTDALMNLIKTMYQGDKGWYEGRYEQTGGHERTFTSATNATVLESLFYKKVGKLYKPVGKQTYIDVLLADEFKRPPYCFPQTRDVCTKKP